MKISQRGKYNTLVHTNGDPVTVTFQTTVNTEPRVVGGKTYLGVYVDVPNKLPEAVFDADQVIRGEEPALVYSPLLKNAETLMIKIGATALVDPELPVNPEEYVEVHMKLGNFGKFGYCWVASNIFRVPSNE